MNAQELLDTDCGPAAADIEQLLQALADHYLDRLQAGEAPDRQALLARYPNIAVALDRRLLLVEMMVRLARERETPAGDVVLTGLETTYLTDPLLAPGPDGVAPHWLDDFEQFRLLGKGSFGKVYRAWQRSLGRFVAVKVTANRGSEARTLAGLEHDHVVTVYSEIVDPERDFRVLVMQYVPGPTLAGVIDALAQRPSHEWSGRALVEAIDELAPQPAAADSATARVRELLAGCDFVEAVCWIGARLAEALAHAHGKNILHLDIKPANILLDRNGRPLLADFNMAIARQPDSPAGGEGFGGTLGYMAPEHLDAYRHYLEARRRGEPAPREAVDERSDVYALGVVLFELLTGERPFGLPAGGLSLAAALPVMAADRRREAPSPRRLRPDIPEVLDRVVRRCLEPDPARRYQTAAELAQVLEGCRELHGLNRAMPADGPLTRTARRWPQATAAILPLLPHLLGALVVFGYTAAWVASHPHRAVLETVFGKLALYYCLVVFPLTGTIAGMLSRPIWGTLVGLRGLGAVDAARVTAARQRALRKPFWGVLLSALGWLPGSVLLPLLMVYLVPEVTGGDVLLHYFLSFVIAGLIALTYTEFVDQFLLLCVAYPSLWADPQSPRLTARTELGPVDRRLRAFQVLSGLIPLATAIVLMFGLVGAGPEQRASAGYQTFLAVVLVLTVLGMAGSWGAVLISGHLGKAITALTGAERR